MDDWIVDSLPGLAAFGAALFALLVALAALFLLGPDSGPARALRKLVPSLRTRTLAAMMVVASLPLISLALVLVERGAGLQAEALHAQLYLSAAWLVGSILVGVALALAVANGVTRPLRRLATMLDAAEADLGTESPAAASDTPIEIAALHARIATVIRRARNETELRTRTEALRRANMTLELLNRTDGLTGLANRPGFEELFHQAWGLAVREHQSIALVCLDIDHFKAYNDEYGHPAGDRCLRAVAGAINGAARRPLDHVARTGGEEFVAVLGDTDLAAAVKVAERMRRAVERLRLPHRGSDSGRWVTVSVGVAADRPARGANPAPLLQTADRALYAAKSRGRNRVVHTVPAPETKQSRSAAANWE